MTFMETTTATTTRNTHSNTKLAQHGCRECGTALPAHRFTCSPCTAALLQRELDQFLPAVAS